jgi:hypothetical protein
LFLVVIGRDCSGDFARGTASDDEMSKAAGRPGKLAKRGN